MKKIYLSGKNGVGKFALIDDEDLDLVSQYNWWYAKHHSSGGYAVSQTSRKNGRRRVAMHRLIMGVKKEEFIDHINLSKLDNRRKNLRICSTSENARNREKYNNNTSGYKGVTWHKGSNKWYSQIVVNYKHIFLGMYDEKDKAIKAYKQAALQYHGEFARA